MEKRSGLWWEVKCTVAEAETLLSVEFSEFIHEQSGKHIYRTLTFYSVPFKVASHITLIANVIRFPPPHYHLSPEDLRGSIEVITTPQSLQQRYKVTVPPHNRSNLQAVVSFLDEYYSPSDLSLFGNTFGFSSDDCQIKKVSIVRGEMGGGEKGGNVMRGRDNDGNF
jgi:tripeptidyl-peptidase I